MVSCVFALFQKNIGRRNVQVGVLEIYIGWLKTSGGAQEGSCSKLAERASRILQDPSLSIRRKLSQKFDKTGQRWSRTGYLA